VKFPEKNINSALSFALALMALIFLSGPAAAQYNAFKDPTASSAASTNAPDFKAVETEIKGGKVAVGGTSFVVVLFKNEGSTLVTVGQVSLYPSSNVAAQVSLNQCADAPLAADAQCAITVSVKGMMAGSWRVDLLVNHNGRSRLATASLSGEVEASSTEKEDAKGDVEIAPASLDFGTSPGGIAQVRSVTLKNRTADSVNIKSVALNGPENSGFSYKSECPAALKPEETCNVLVTWQPTSRGLAQGVLVVQHSGKSGMAQADVQGTLKPADSAAKEDTGTVDLSSTSLDFGTAAGGIALKRSVVLTNHTAEDVEIWDVDMDVSEQSGLSYDSQCPETLKQGESCNIIVTWKPTTAGLAQGVLVVQHSGKTGTAQAEVKGLFQPPEDKSAPVTADKVDLTPESVDFGTLPGGIAQVRSVTLKNQTAESITIKGVSLESPEQAGFSYKSECPAALKPEETCNIIVSWQPTTKGLAQGVLVVQHSGKSGMAQSALKGTFQPPEDKSAPVTADKVDLTPDSVDFGTLPGGIAQVRSVTLKNQTAESITIKGVSLESPEQAGFSYKSECPAALKPEETCNIIVSWQPTTKGEAQGVLVVQHSGKSGMAQAALKGTFQPPEQVAGAKEVEGNVDVTPDSLDFGTSAGGIALKRSVVLTNHSTNDIEIWSVDMDVSDKSGFTYDSQCPETLKAGESCSVVITWLPTTKGLAQGVLMVEHSGKSGMAQAQVQATFKPEEVTAPKEASTAVDLTPTSLDFGTSPGGIAQVRSVVLKNQTPEAITIKNVALESPDKSGFAYKSECPVALKPDESCNIIVTWQPTSKGLAQGVLVVQHSGKSGTAQAEVKGLFQPPEDKTAPTAEGKVEITPADLDFGTSPGGIAQVRPVTLKNNTADSIAIKSVALEGPEKSGFSYKSECPVALKPEEACNIIVTWQPTSNGLAQGVLVVQHSGKSGTAQAEIKGVLLPPAEKTVTPAAEGKIDLTPDNLDFGTSAGGIALKRSAVLTNHSTDDIEIWSVDMDVSDKSGFTYDSQCPETLKAGESCSVVISWLPTTKGLSQGVLMVEHSGKSGMAQAQVQGTFKPEEVAAVKEASTVVDLTPASLDFGTSPGGIAQVRSVVLKNQTADSVAIKNISLETPDKSGFTYKSECPVALKPQEACNIIVTWQPTSKGLAQGIVVVQHSGPSGTAQAEVKGDYKPDEAAAKEVSDIVDLAPASLDFGMSPGGIAQVRSVVLKNHTSDSVAIKNVSLEGSDKSGFTYKSECPAALKPQEACNIIVTWQPTSKGLAQGVVVVQHSGPSGTAQAEVKGLLQPEQNAAGKDAEGKVDITPDSLDFGTSSGGLAMMRSMQVNNNSAEDVEIWDVDLDVADKSGFSYKSQCPEMLSPGESCSIVVTWQPTTAGLAQGVMVVQHSGKNGMSRAEIKGLYQLADKGPDGKPATEGKIEATPASLDFGSSAGGISAVRSVIVSNGTPESVDIKGVVLDVPEQSGFSSKSECPQTLAAGKSCNIVVTWLPTVKGTAEGVLIVQHTGKSGMTQIDVKGTLQPQEGKTAALYPEITPNRGLLVSDKEKVDFGASVKKASAITMTLVNSGSAALTLKGMELSGVEDDLEVADDGCAPETVLQPGEACPLTLSWDPEHGGSMLDSLRITHTGARGVLVIPVSGTADATVGVVATDPGASAPGKSSSGTPSPIISIGHETPMSMKATLSGYTVTSHSASRAVLSGPNGGQVVRDGENIILEGIDCTVTIVPTGVILSNKSDKVKLPFDSALSMAGPDLAPGAAVTAPVTAPISGTPSALPPSLTPH